MTDDLEDPQEAASSSIQPSASQVARDQAAQLSQSVSDAADRVAVTAAEETQDVASQARRQARDFLWHAQGQLKDRARTQQRQLAPRLHGFADELSAMAANGDQEGLPADFARRAAGGLRDMASSLEQHEPADAVQEVSDFARRRPGVFLLTVAGAGIAAGRLGRRAWHADRRP